MRVYIAVRVIARGSHYLRGVTYTDAHITLTGMLIVCAARFRRGVAAVNAVRTPRTLAGRGDPPRRSLYIALQIVAWYVSSLLLT